MAALSVIAIVGIQATNVNAYTANSLGTTATEAYDTVKNVRVATFAMETCTNQMDSGDYSNIDACASIIKTMNSHMAQVVAEANSDIAKVTGSVS